MLEALLAKYAEAGIASLESLDILKIDPLVAFGTPMEIIESFGGKKQYIDAIREIEHQLYREAS